MGSETVQHYVLINGTGECGDNGRNTLSTAERYVLFRSGLWVAFEERITKSIKCREHAVIVDDVVNRSGGRIPGVLTYRGLRSTYVYLR
jgi:hypothetical protein